MKFSPINLKIGDVITVGPDPAPPQELGGFVWLQTPDYPAITAKCGWVQWEPVAPPLDAPLTDQWWAAVRNRINSRAAVAGAAPVNAPPPPSPLPPAAAVSAPALEGQSDDALRSRVGRQRRELRRLNQQMRTMRLERDHARTTLEDTMALLIATRKAQRAAERMVDHDS